MTPKERAAMQQALEFLESGDFVYPSKIATALREALAEQSYDKAHGISSYHLQETEQAEQEPVAYRVWDRMGGISYRRTKPSESEYVEWDALYAAPVRTKDLTDDEIEWLVVDTLETWNSKDTMKDFARAVIAAYKEKNK